MIVGTCRVWRGPSNGVGWNASNALSGSLTGDSLPCTGYAGSGLVITSLATGGPLNSGGSQVIYAGTSNGFVYVTSNASSANPTWSAGNIKSIGFPISDIALDPSDPTGMSAYATVLGFGVGHLFKTNNGTYWQDISGDLPDAPAGSALVDPGDPNIIYLSTDIGVFLTTNGGVNWMEYGPSVGTAGFLPNAPVARLRAFVNGSTRSLRAATYGRGVWEVTMPPVGPDFVLAATTPKIEIYPTQTAAFKGRVTSTAGYAHPVNVTCAALNAAAVPSSCSGGSVQPVSGGAEFTVTVSSSTVGDYRFNLIATGTDAGSTTHASPVLLRVVDLALPPLQPSSVSVAAGSVATLPGVTAVASGSFDGTVTITCDPASLPANSTCSLISGNPIPGLPLSGSISVTTQTATPVGSYTVKLIASAEDPTGTRTQSFTLKVTAPPPDFSVSSGAGGSPTISPGQSVTFNINITSQFGVFNNPVTFACAPPLPRGVSCSFAPPSATPGISGASTQLTITTTAPHIVLRAPSPGRDGRTSLYAWIIPGTFSFLVGLITVRNRKRRKITFFMLLLVISATVLIGCAGGAGTGSNALSATSTGTPPGTYSITVDATSGSFSHATSVTFTVH